MRNVIGVENTLRMQEGHKTTHSNLVDNKGLRNYCNIFPNDIVDIRGGVKHVLPLVGGKKVVITYCQIDKKISADVMNNEGEIYPVREEDLPKELRDISNYELLKAFLNGSYAKVSVLSDGNYKLYINHRLLGGVKDQPEGSMTPRTQGPRRIEKTKETDRLSEETKQKLEQEMKAFSGLNETEMSTFAKQYIKSTTKVLQALQEGVVFSQFYQQNIREKDLQHFVDPTADKPLVVRFGMNSDALGVIVGSPLDKKTLHPIEVEVFQLAIEVLTKVPDAKKMLQQGMVASSVSTLLPSSLSSSSMSKYPNNIVLVDIFVRTDENKIKKEHTSDSPETHTIALWKKSENEILLIDPSKVDFSKDLLGAINVIASKSQLTAKIHSPSGGILYGTGGKDTGYNELLSTSISEHKHRDCVDIAVKIGFELNELQLDDNISSLEQITRAMDLQISNQKAVATYLTNTNNGQPNRASQSSDLKIRHSNRQMLELLK